MRLESSVDSQESSLDTTATSQEQASDDEDDELLALRIAALESIKIKEAKAKADAKKPEFMIKSHPARGNLVSIVTCEDELKQGGEAKRNGSKLQSNRLASPPPSLPPPVLPVFDRTRPPPGFGGEVFVSEPLIPFPPPRRFSRSPRRWSRSPPPRRSPSPYRRRRSPSPLHPRRYRSRSPSPPPPRRRSPSPPGPRRRTGSASPPRRRSPPRRSAPRSPSPEFSEWETDTEDEEEEGKEQEGDEKKKEEDQKETKEPVKEVSKTEIKKKVDAADEDDGPDDFLKLDATAEVDEFSQFLNEFEDEVLDESKKKEATVDVKKVKKDRPVTEKKVVEGKKLRKKVKPVRSPPRPRSRSPRAGSPLRWRKSSERRSPGGRYFVEERRGSRGSPGRKRVGQSPGVEPAAGGKRRSPNARSRSPEKRSSKPKERLGAPAKPKETALERKEREEKELKEKKEKEEQDYQERLSKLSTPEREIMEARKKKFEARSSVSEGKTKISLKTSQSTPSMALVTKKKAPSDSGKVSGGLISASKRALEVGESKKVSEGTDSPEAKFDTGPKAKSAALKADKFPRAGKDSEESRRGGKADNNGDEGEQEELAQDRGMVTDLRVRLHKKKQEAVGKKVDKVANSGRVGEDEEEVSGRKVVPPGRTPPIASRLSQPRSERSVSRSPSPPPHKRKKRSSGEEVKKSREVEEEEELDDKPMLGGRRIIVARPRSLSPESAASSPENLQVITSNMKKGMKKSLSSRLGPVDPSVQQQFSEKEIYEEMLRQQERRRIAIEEKEIKKLKKAMKKKERLERKLKKHDKKESRKKSKKVLDDDSDFSEGDMLASLDLLKAKQEQLAQAPAKADVDSDEELYRFFEEPEPERKEKKGRHTAQRCIYLLKMNISA